MTFKISKFLRSFSYKTNEINRLLVSTFIYSNNIEVRNNNLIKELLLNGNDAAVCSLSKLVIDTYQEFSIELLIELFEFVISPAEKEVNGAVYTPKNIRDFIVQESFNNFPLVLTSLSKCQQKKLYSSSSVALSPLNPFMNNSNK